MAKTTEMGVDRYNIKLTNAGEPVDFHLECATAKEISTFLYIKPLDERCLNGMARTETEMLNMLKPVLGSSFEGELNYSTDKQVVVSLHDTAVLGYKRMKLIDPRLNNVIGILWEVYTDKRVFAAAEDDEWSGMMGLLISTDLIDPQAPMMLAENIKNAIVRDSGGGQYNG